MFYKVLNHDSTPKKGLPMSYHCCTASGCRQAKGSGPSDKSPSLCLDKPTLLSVGQLAKDLATKSRVRGFSARACPMSKNPWSASRRSNLGRSSIRSIFREPSIPPIHNSVGVTPHLRTSSSFGITDHGPLLSALAPLRELHSGSDSLLTTRKPGAFSLRLSAFA
jgi:hypothetical protein